jgi:glutamyl-tRNA synthetase
MTTRVRFAPSPTGDLHVGGLRTALYNVLFARKTGGRFILRIEDTDRERNVPGAVETIVRILEICGLDPDEGPHLGGDYAPYIQSERLEHYRRFAQQLLESGHAYPCFCTEEQLKIMREEQRSRGFVQGSDHLCRGLNDEQARERMLSERHVLRLSVPLDGDIVHNDLIWGDLTFPLTDIDDQVLVKSDGFPTYHLANVVDDHLMRISHVIRGEEWLPSVPKHLLLYRFLGWEPPQFAHLPLILNEKRQKLSKREGTGSVMAWLERGILPQALVNYVTLLGWHASDDRDFFAFADLVEAFDLTRVGKAGAVFDPVKLEWLSGEHIKSLTPEELAFHARPFLKGMEFEALLPERLQAPLEAVRQGLHRLDELPAKLLVFAHERPVPDEEARAWLASEAAAKALPPVLEAWRKMPQADAEALLGAVRDVGKATGIKGKDLWMPLRAALTGRVGGPELKVVLAHLGAEEVMNRLVTQIQGQGE